MSWPTPEAVKRGARAVRLEGAPTAEDIARAVLEAVGQPDYVGHTEVRELIGLRSPNLERVAGLPAAAQQIAGKKVWLREEVEAFAAERAQRRAS